MGIASFGFELFDSFAAPLRVARPEENADILLTELPCDFKTETFVCACDDGDFALGGHEVEEVGMLRNAQRGELRPAFTPRFRLAARPLPGCAGRRCDPRLRPTRRDLRKWVHAVESP